MRAAGSCLAPPRARPTGTGSAGTRAGRIPTLSDGRGAARPRRRAEAARAPAAGRGLRRARSRARGTPPTPSPTPHGLAVQRARGLHGDGASATGRASRGTRWPRASPTSIRSGRDTPHLVAPPGGETLDDGRRARARRPRGAAARRTTARPICLVTHGIVARAHRSSRRSASAARAAVVGRRVARPASRRSSSAPDWTTLHRMNTLAHLDERAGDAVGVRPARGRSPADAAAQGRASIYLPDEAARKRARRGAPPRRLPALGLSRDRDADLRVLRRALAGHRRRRCRSACSRWWTARAGACSPCARTSRRRSRASWPRGCGTSPSRSRLGYVTNVFRYDEPQVAPLPRVLPGGRGADRARRSPEARRRDDRDDRRGAARARPRALPDRRRPARLLPRHPRGRRRRRRPPRASCARRSARKDAATLERLRRRARARPPR